MKEPKHGTGAGAPADTAKRMRTGVCGAGDAGHRLVDTKHIAVDMVRAMQGQGHANATTETIPYVTVLCPAHQEEERIGETLRSLLTQTIAPDRIIVVADNCTDDTPVVAQSFPMVEVLETVGNKSRKAGALNYALDALALPDDTFVLVVDADTILNPQFIEYALKAFDDPEVAAVGGLFVGEDVPGIIGRLESLEYHRYTREINRSYGKARVLTGTSTMSRMSVFREVKAAREAGTLPGRGYYNPDIIVEDFCFTLSVKRLGYKTVSPKQCTVTTEVMNSIPALWRQRYRWCLGAFIALKDHGMNRVTIPYAIRQVEAALGITANIAILTLITWSLVTGSFQLVPLWMLIGSVFMIERVVSAAGYGKRGIAIAGTIVLDMVFDLMISVVWMYSIARFVLGDRGRWGIASADAPLTEGAK